MRIFRILSNVVLLLVLALPFGSRAQVRLPQLISDHMVLQRDRPINIWGWASPSEKVTVTFDGHSYKTVAAADSGWQIKIHPTKAGGPYTMEIHGRNRITLQDILVGDVWFCSGQSNMVLNMERVKEKYPDDIAQANFPQIRNFFVPTVSDVVRTREDLPPSKWIEANPQNVLTFGAATWFFAKSLYDKYQIPVGIINSSVGGTPIQAWISADGLKDISNYAERVSKFRDTSWLDKQLHPATFRFNSGRLRTSPDQGMSGAAKWYDPVYVPEGWHPFWLPGYWADQGIKGLNGIVWFRKEIEVPQEMAGRPAKLFVGRIVDADETYINGVRVGNITYQYPPRRYEVPAGVLRAGKNLLVVRVTNTLGKGGFVPDKRYELTDGVHHIDIRGDWQYKVGQVFPPRNFSEGGAGSAGGAPPFSAQNEPTGLFNTMVAPAIRETITGFLWYQGEANTGKPKEYRQLLPALVHDWREKWGEGELPFLYVQLPNFMEVQYSPSESQWAELRETQRLALSEPNTAMAVAIDAGEWNDIHPLDKKDVGERLALAAEHLAYGDKDVVYSGPLYRQATIAGDSVVLSFDHTGGGLIAKGGGSLQGFAIAGEDKKFVWAKARIEGDQVVVSSDEVPAPKYVRYAWADNPAFANLYNKEGLPASPFGTDAEP
jgi:sialate O-acetylesterase